MHSKLPYLSLSLFPFACAQTSVTAKLKPTRPKVRHFHSNCDCFSQSLLIQQSSSRGARHGFATSHELGGPVWSPLNVFSAVRLSLKDVEAGSGATRCRCSSGPLHHCSYYSWDNPNCFLSPRLSLSSAVSVNSCSDYSRVHGGTLLYILKSHLALGTFPQLLPSIS